MAAKQISEYVLITNSNPMQLSIKVNEKIKTGWIPLYGVSAATAMDQGNNLTTYAQAMIKYKDG